MDNLRESIRFEFTDMNGKKHVITKEGPELSLDDMIIFFRAILVTAGYAGETADQLELDA